MKINKSLLDYKKISAERFAKKNNDQKSELYGGDHAE